MVASPGFPAPGCTAHVALPDIDPVRKRQIQPLVRWMKAPAQVRILGKGRKVRVVPLMENTTRLLQQYIDESDLALPENYDRPLFRNKIGNQLTRVGVNYILQKHMQKVRDRYPHLKQKISPHTLRHTKAMHLVQGGVSLDIVRDFFWPRRYQNHRAVCQGES